MALPLSVWIGVAPTVRAEQAPAKPVVLETVVFDSEVLEIDVLESIVGELVSDSVSSHGALVRH